MKLTTQHLRESQATFLRLSQRRQIVSLTRFEAQLLHGAAETLISVYSQYCDLGDLTDEDLEGLE